MSTPRTKKPRRGGKALSENRRTKNPKPRTARMSKRGQAPTKIRACLDLLSRPNGASLDDLRSITGWLPHSVRGFLAGTVKKKLGLALTSEQTGDGTRRYRIDRVPA